MKVLLTGISGNIGRLVTHELLERGHSVIGIDVRPWPDMPSSVRVFQGDIRKRPAEDVFRRERPQAVIHLATVTHLTHASPDRYRINLGGTQAVFDDCARYGVEQAIFVGRHTYYGAAPDSPLYHTEAEPPMAVHTFPELSDLVAADLYAGSALWRFPALRTAVLRCCYTLGPMRQGTLAGFIKGPRVPTVMGFDPLFHFMHERDTAHAIVLALEHDLRGVFNVAGPPPVPLSVVIEQTGRNNIALPEPLFRLALGRFGLPNLPPGAILHIKYPIVIDNALFCAATSFEAKFSTEDTLRAFRSATGR